MTKAITRSVVAVLLLGVAACSKAAPPAPTPTEKIRDQVCACKDKACAQALVPLYDETSHKEAEKPGGWTKADHEAMNMAVHCLDTYMLDGK